MALQLIIFKIQRNIGISKINFLKFSIQKIFYYKNKRTMAAKFCIQIVCMFSVWTLSVPKVFKNLIFEIPKFLWILNLLHTLILIYKKCSSSKLCIQFVHKICTQCIQIIVPKIDPTFQHILTRFLWTSWVIIAHNWNVKPAG